MEKQNKKSSLNTSGDESLRKLSSLLYENYQKEKRLKTYVSVKEVLSLIGKGSLLICSLLAPGTARLLKLFETSDHEWKRFNKSYLLKALLKLEKQKFIKIYEKNNGKYSVEITKNGRKKILSSSLAELSVSKPVAWDGKWYFVSYDIPKGNDYLRDQIRRHLERLGFYQFQKSIYLHAFPCEKEIDFLCGLLGISEYVRIIKAVKIENDKVFREYFGV